jgi:SAM-dependent methyltransferase
MGETSTRDGFEQVGPLELRNQLQDEHGSHPVPWFRWVFERLDFVPGSQVLELGSGAGELWQQAGAAVEWQVIQSDQSIGMLQARSSFPALAMDAQAAAFTDSSFDAVLALGLLDLVPSRGQTLAEIRRVLRPGGWLVCSAGGRHHLEEMEDLLKPFLPEASLGGEPQQFGLENGRAILAPYFDTVDRQVYRDELVFERAEPLLDYLLSEADIRAGLQGDALTGFVAVLKRSLERAGQLRVQREKALFRARRSEVEFSEIAG